MNNNIIHFFNTKEKGDDIMCKTLRNLKDLSPSDLLEKYNISSDPPIDIGTLLKRIGIISLGIDFKKAEEESNYEENSILGATIIDDNDIIIFYRENDSLNRKRFTIAHELAHCCKDYDNLTKGHVELRNDEISLSGKEYDANIFAGELLIPSNSLMYIYDKLLVPSLSVLSSIYQVSTNVMAARLDYLKKPYLKDISIDDN